MQKPYAKWIDFLYGPIFRLIGFIYRVHTNNRARLAAFKAHHQVAAIFKLVTVLIVVGWLLVWFFASPESRHRLVDDVKQSIGIFNEPSARPAPKSAPD